MLESFSFLILERKTLQKVILKVKKGRFTTKNFCSSFLVGEIGDNIMRTLFLLFLVYSKTDYSLISPIE